jgi:hypothetical protein
MTGTDNPHGVRQLPPFEVLADAPGGMESIVKVASVGGGNRSKLGMFEDTDEQLASERPNTTATHAHLMFMPVLLVSLSTIDGPGSRFYESLELDGSASP